MRKRILPGARRRFLSLAGAALAASLAPAWASAQAREIGAVEAITTRRSVRRYTGQDVPDALVTELLGLAMQAPSACNQQPWQFLVLRDKALLGQVGAINPYAKYAKNAPVAVLVCGDTRLEKCPGYWVQDCSNASLTLLLAAHAKGLGAVWTGIYPLPERVGGFQKLCGLPGEVIPLSLIVLGYPAVVPQPEVRFKADRIRQDHW